MNRLISIHKGRIQLSIMILLIAILALSDALAAENLYFVFGQPRWVQMNKKPYETSIFILDESRSSFNKVWSVGENVQTRNIKTYYSCRKIMISEGDLNIEKLHIIPMNDINEAYILDLGKLGAVSDYRYLDIRDEIDQLRIGHKEIKNGRESESKFIRINVNDKNLKVKQSTVFNGEVRLSGTRTEFGGGETDAAYVTIDSSGNLWSPDDDISDFNGLILPDSMIQIKKNRGWGIIAYESSYLVLLSTPEYQETDSREVLIYNRLNRSWRSIIVNGSRTSLRQINSWLIGIIAYPDLANIHYPSILAEDIIVVNPIEARQFTVHIGKNAEVLWIDTSQVYYRVDNQLYKARIENDDFVDRQLLLTDPRVRHFHWAFTGKSPKQIENEKME